MRRWGLLVTIVAMAATAAACGGDGGDDDASDDPLATNPPVTVAAPTTAPGPTVPSTDLLLRITDVRLINSEESDNGMRVLLPAGVATATVSLSGVPSPNQVILVCQAQELDRRMSGATCRTPANGETVSLPLAPVASGVEIIQVGVAGTGPGGNSASLQEITIRYAASSRELNVRLPQIASGDGGGRPTFGLTPPSNDGAYRAQLSWSVIPVFGGNPSNGQLELLQGGTVTNQSQSSADVRLTGTIPPPVRDVALRVQNLGTAALVTPKLTAVLP